MLSHGLQRTTFFHLTYNEYNTHVFRQLEQQLTIGNIDAGRNRASTERDDV